MAAYKESYKTLHNLNPFLLEKHGHAVDADLAVSSGQRKAPL